MTKDEEPMIMFAVEFALKSDDREKVNGVRNWLSGHVRKMGTKLLMDLSEAISRGIKGWVPTDNNKIRWEKVIREIDKEEQRRIESILW